MAHNVKHFTWTAVFYLIMLFDIVVFSIRNIPYVLRNTQMLIGVYFFYQLIYFRYLSSYSPALKGREKRSQIFLWNVYENIYTVVTYTLN